jgi:hypothetical protein
MKLLIALLLVASNTHAGAGTWAAVMAASQVGRHSSHHTDMSGYLKLREAIMKRAGEVARDEPGAHSIKVLHVFSTLFCKDSPPFFVIKIMDKKDKDLAFMLWGLDSTAGKRVWRLVVYEKNLEDFNHYCANTPFFMAVVKDPTTVVVSVC